MRNLVIWGAAALLLYSIPPAQAETQRLQNGTEFGGWTVACEALAVNETVCVLSQRLVRAGDGGLLADLLAFSGADAPGAYVAARVPNGVFFPSGFSLRADDVDSGDEILVDFAWQSCSPDICEALLPLSAETAGAFDTVPDWVAAYRPGIDAEALVFRLDPSGLQEGLSALAAALGLPDPFSVDLAETE